MNIVKNTPIITHFKNLGLPVPEHFNQSMMLSCAKRLNMFTLKASFNILIQYHDMLRAVWNGENLNIRDVTDSNLFYLEEHNLKNTADVEEAMLPICNALQSSIDLAHGPLMRVAVFHLPEYMVPSAFVQLDAMPLTPNGKIDRKALPEPDYVQEEYVAPENRNEKLICKTIEGLLGIEHIGVTDSFRSCGMSSIQAMRLNMQLHKAGIHLNLSSIIKADNIRNLCQCIDEGIDNSDVGCWLNEFDATKPTIVLCCGVIGDEMITKNLSGFKKKYNIYVLQPIFNAWTDIEELSHEEIVSRYLKEMMRDILRPGSGQVLRPRSGQVQSDISCIMGFSYGGELAYHLAVRWNAHTGQKPMVFMGDTVITDVKPDNRHQPAYKDEMEAYYYGLQTEFFSKRERLSVPDYPGKVILISAEKESSYRIANEQEWTAHNTHINIIPVNDTHNGLFENAGHFDEYLSLIENTSAQK